MFWGLLVVLCIVTYIIYVGDGSEEGKVCRFLLWCALIIPLLLQEFKIYYN